MSWQNFWVFIMLAAVAGYFGMAVVIAIGGWFDIWKMLRRLSGKAEPDEQQG